MKPDKTLLILITGCLVWLAVFFGSHIPAIELRSPIEGTTPKGYFVLAVRCGFFFLAFISALFVFDSIEAIEEEER